MKTVSVLVLLLSVGCIQFRPSQLVTGALGRQCKGPRIVRCDVGNEDCQHVERVVARINADMGRPMFDFQGYTSCYTIKGDNHAACLLQEFNAGVLIVTAPPRFTRADPFNERPQTVAHTLSMTDAATGCFEAQLVVLDMDPRDMSPEYRFTMILHEFLHVLGVPHAIHPRSETVMFPASPDKNERPYHIPAADLAMLRAIYGF